jgi:hypothetical protein
MKTLLYIFTFSLLACSNGELTKKQAYQILQKDYPKIIYYSIYTADPDHATKIRQQGLVNAGLATVDTNAGFLKQCIFFPQKAGNLLLPTPEKEKARLIQRVKTGERYVFEITGIKMLEKNKAVVEYSTEVRNVTPFSRLSKKPIKEGDKGNGSAYFTKYTDGWRVDHRNSLDILVE